MKPGEARAGAGAGGDRDDLESRHRDMVRDPRRDIITFLDISADLAENARLDAPGRSLEVLSLALDIAQYAEDDHEVSVGVALARQMRGIAGVVSDDRRTLEAIDWESRLLERGGVLTDGRRIELLLAEVHPLVRLGRNSDANHRLARALDASTMAGAPGLVHSVARDAVLNVLAHPLGALGASHLRARLHTLDSGGEFARAWAEVIGDALALSSGDDEAARVLLDHAVTDHTDPALSALATLVRMSAANQLDRHADALKCAEQLPDGVRVDLRIEAALALEAAAAALDVGRLDDADHWSRASLSSEKLEPLAVVRAHEVAAGVAIALRHDRDAATHLMSARRLTPLTLAGQRPEEPRTRGLAEIDLRATEDEESSTDEFGYRRRVVALERALDERSQQLEAVLGRRGGAEIEQLVLEALVNDWFELWFQPIRINATDRVGGAEALLRLRHPDRGILHPGAFLRSGISDGTQSALNEWVISHSCGELARWGQMQIDVGVSINISGSWIDPDLAAMVAHAVESSGVDARLVTMEITEESPLPLGPATSGAIADLRQVGVRIALDDFGTGFSSLDHLLRLDVDEVKIDQRFAARLDTDPRSAAIVAAVVAMSDDLDFDVVVEGIETAEAFAAQQRLGVHAAQGFFIAPPRPAAGFGGALSGHAGPGERAGAGRS